MYIGPGIDRDKVFADARATSKGDERNPPEKVYVHVHSARVTCRGHHMVYENGKEVERW